jgi:hypothetical protein
MRLRVNFSPFSLRKLATIFGATLAVATVLNTIVLESGTTFAGATAAVSRCTTAQLVVWLNTSGSGAAGSSYYNLEFTNLSTHSCSLIGYPGVSAIGVAGQQLGSAASHDAEHADALITLSSGSANSGLDGFQTGNTATVVLQITDASNYPNATCRRVAAAGLRVYPPNQTASKLVPFPFVACSHHGPLVLHVESVQKGVTTS